MYLCNGYSRCLFSSVSHLSVFMGSFDAGLVLDLAQNIIFSPRICDALFPIFASHFTESGFSEHCSWRIRIMYIHSPESVLSAPVSFTLVLVFCLLSHLFDLVQPAQFCCCKALVSRPSRCEAPAGQRWSMGCRSPLTRLRVLLKAQYACCCFCISTHTHSFAPHVFRTVPFLCRPAEGAS